MDTEIETIIKDADTERDNARISQLSGIPFSSDPVQKLNAGQLQMLLRIQAYLIADTLCGFTEYNYYEHIPSKVAEYKERYKELHNEFMKRIR
jgi:hypothetical protein